MLEQKVFKTIKKQKWDHKIQTSLIVTSTASILSKSLLATMEVNLLWARQEATGVMNQIRMNNQHEWKSHW